MLLDPEINGAAQEVASVGVLTVDDQAVFREIARRVIEETPGFHSVGEADSGEAAVEAAQRLRPGLVLLDVRMSGIGGVEAARRISSARPDVVVVLISADDIDQLRSDFQSSGAAACERKQDLCPGRLRELWWAHGRSSHR
jgi:DNA-binding NarL/FixJ family response regulator